MLILQIQRANAKDLAGLPCSCFRPYERQTSRQKYTWELSNNDKRLMLDARIQRGQSRRLKSSGSNGELGSEKNFNDLLQTRRWKNGLRDDCVPMLYDPSWKSGDIFLSMNATQLTTIDAEWSTFPYYESAFMCDWCTRGMFQVWTFSAHSVERDRQTDLYFLLAGESPSSYCVVDLYFSSGLVSWRTFCTMYYVRCLAQYDSF